MGNIEHCPNLLRVKKSFLKNLQLIHNFGVFWLFDNGDNIIAYVSKEIDFIISK